MSRDYKKEYAEYHSKPEQKKNRAKRNKANRNSNCGPGQEVDHKVPLKSGGSNSPSNWRVVSRKTNRKKGAKKMSSFHKLKEALRVKEATTAGYDESTSTSNYISMSAPRARKASGEMGMYRQVPIVDSPLENRSFLGLDQGPQPYVLSENAARLREELAAIAGLDVAPEDYVENYADEGPVVEYGHLGYDLGEEKEKLILEALRRGRVSSKEKTANAALNTLKGMASQATSGIKGMASQATSGVKGMASQATSGVKGGLDNVKYFSCLLYTSPSPRDQRGSRMAAGA